MRTFISQHGGTILEAAGALIVIGLMALAFLGGGLSMAAQHFSAWLYG